MKKIFTYAIIAIVAIAAIIIWGLKPKTAEQPPAASEATETAPVIEGEPVEVQIDQELQGIDFGDLEEEFQAIDKDLNSL